MRYKLGAVFLSSSVATFAYPFQFLNPALAEMFLWVVIRYIFLFIFVFSVALLVFDFCRIPILFKSWKFFFIAILPAIVILFLAVNPTSALFYRQIGLVPIRDFLAIDWTVVVLFIVLQLYGTGLMILLIYILFRNFGKQTKLIRINTILIASGIFLYVFTHILQLGGVRIAGIYNLNMFTYFPSSLLALWGVRRYRLADIRSIAYPNIFYQNHYGMLIVDPQGYLVDFNTAAVILLDAQNRLVAGDRFDVQKLRLPTLPKPEDLSTSILSQTEVNGTPLQVEVSGLVDPQGVFYAYVVSVQDITSQVEAERLKEAEIIRHGVWSERMRLARNLHDSTPQNLGSLILLSGSISESLKNQQTVGDLDLLDNLKTGAHLAYDDLRTLINELQINEDTADGFNLTNALDAKIRFLNQQNETKITFNLPIDFSIEPQQQRELYYIIMEALNNALKHANAESVVILLESKDDILSAEIVDNGCGFDVQKPSNSGMGLENMHSRAALLKGQLFISSIPSKGTVVRVELPCSRKHSDNHLAARNP